MGLWAVFLVGLVTSFHCIAMCGNFVLAISVTDKETTVTPSSVVLPHLMYNGTRMLSYTVVGVGAGLVGSAISLGGYKGYINIGAGAFMILMALNMLNVHPWLRAFSFRLPRRVSSKIFKTTERADSFAPAVFGLCGGIMPCGPLQAMVLYAAATGSALRGGLTMLVFGIATVPLMLAYGTVASTLAKRYRTQLNAVGAAVIIILGLVIINRGLVLTGSNYNFSYATQQLTALFVPTAKPPATPRAKIQNITLEARDGYIPNTITVTKNTPVRLTVVNPGNDMCAESIVFPSLGIDKKLKQYGKTVISFTAPNEGRFVFSSGCGMWQGTLVVARN
jgi:sulfite exporter TauE/SafE